MLSSPPYGALCTKYRALIAEMQKRKRPILCYSEFRAKALVRQTITDVCIYIYIYIYIFIYKSCYRADMLYGGETWCLREYDRVVLRRTKAMMKAMCGMKLMYMKITRKSIALTMKECKMMILSDDTRGNRAEELEQNKSMSKHP